MLDLLCLFTERYGMSIFFFNSPHFFCILKNLFYSLYFIFETTFTMVVSKVL